MNAREELESIIDRSQKFFIDLDRDGQFLPETEGKLRLLQIRAIAAADLATVEANESTPRAESPEVGPPFVVGERVVIVDETFPFHNWEGYVHRVHGELVEVMFKDEPKPVTFSVHSLARVYSGRKS